MEALTSDELDFLLGLVNDYLDNELDLNQREWGFAVGVRDNLSTEIDAREFLHD